MVIKKNSLPRAFVDEIFVWNTKDFHDTGQLLLFILAGENWEPSVQLSQNATQTPDIDCHMIVHTKDNFWGAIETTLNIGVDLFVLEAATTEVDDFDSALRRVPQQDILWLEITVNNTVVAHQLKRH